MIETPWRTGFSCCSSLSSSSIIAPVPIAATATPVSSRLPLDSNEFRARQYRCASVPWWPSKYPGRRQEFHPQTSQSFRRAINPPTAGVNCHVPFGGEPWATSGRSLRRRVPYDGPRTANTFSVRHAGVPQTTRRRVQRNQSLREICARRALLPDR